MCVFLFTAVPITMLFAGGVTLHQAAERPQSTVSKPYPRLSFSTLEARSGFLRFFNLYDKSRPENQTKRGEIDLFRTISKVLVYVLESFSLRFCSKRIDFRAILRNTLGTPVDPGLSMTLPHLRSLRSRDKHDEQGALTRGVWTNAFDFRSGGERYTSAKAR